MVESDKIIRKDFNIDRDHIPIEEQKNIFNELVEERFSRLKGLEKRTNPDNLIYKHKTEEISPKGFRNYQNPRVFKDLRCDNMNPKEVLKYQIINKI